MMEVAYANALAFAALLLANLNYDEEDVIYPMSVADMFITIGALLLFLSYFISKRKV